MPKDADPRLGSATPRLPVESGTTSVLRKPLPGLQQKQYLLYAIYTGTNQSHSLEIQERTGTQLVKSDRRRDQHLASIQSIQDSQHVAWDYCIPNSLKLRAEYVSILFVCQLYISAFTDYKIKIILFHFFV